jgi:hypothetical protein
MKNLNDLAQQVLPMLTEIPKPKMLPAAEVEACKNYGDAVNLCLQHRIRHINESEIARYLGFKPPHFVKVKRGMGYLTSDQEVILQRLCSNTAIEQYADLRKRELAEMLEGEDWEKRQMRQQIADLQERLRVA